MTGIKKRDKREVFQSLVEAAKNRTNGAGKPRKRKKTGGIGFRSCKCEQNSRERERERERKRESLDSVCPKGVSILSMRTINGSGTN